MVYNMISLFAAVGQGPGGIRSTVHTSKPGHDDDRSTRRPSIAEERIVRCRISPIDGVVSRYHRCNFQEKLRSRNRACGVTASVQFTAE